MAPPAGLSWHLVQSMLVAQGQDPPLTLSSGDTGMQRAAVGRASDSGVRGRVVPFRRT